MRALLPGLGSIAWIMTIAGCNAVLGIAAPIPIRDDGGDGVPDASVGVDSGFDDDAGPIDAGDDDDPTHARPQWRMPNPPLTGVEPTQAYAVQQNIVTDQVTGLTWQRAASGIAMAWRDADALCRNLNIAGGGFRLPSRIELLSLLDVTQVGSTIDPNAFPDTPAEGFWASTAAPGPPDSAWGVQFGFTTSVTFQDDKVHDRRVRCVRSDGQGAPGQLIVSDSVVRDTATQLEWQRQALVTQYAWDAANSYCATLALNGGGWRLPTLKELHTLIDETRQHPAADPVTFPGIAASFHWSASQPKAFINLAWAVDFDRGLDVFRNTTSTAFVRCVR